MPSKRVSLNTSNVNFVKFTCPWSLLVNVGLASRQSARYLFLDQVTFPAESPDDSRCRSPLLPTCKLAILSIGDPNDKWISSSCRRYADEFHENCHSIPLAGSDWLVRSAGRSHPTASSKATVHCFTKLPEKPVLSARTVNATLRPWNFNAFSDFCKVTSLLCIL